MLSILDLSLTVQYFPVLQRRRLELLSAAGLRARKPGLQNLSPRPRHVFGSSLWHLLQQATRILWCFRRRARPKITFRWRSATCKSLCLQNSKFLRHLCTNRYFHPHFSDVETATQSVKPPCSGYVASHPGSLALNPSYVVPQQAIASWTAAFNPKGLGFLTRPWDSEPGDTGEGNYSAARSFVVTVARCFS